MNTKLILFKLCSNLRCGGVVFCYLCSDCGKQRVQFKFTLHLNKKNREFKLYNSIYWILKTELHVHSKFNARTIPLWTSRYFGLKDLKTIVHVHPLCHSPPAYLGLPGVTVVCASLWCHQYKLSPCRLSCIAIFWEIIWNLKMIKLNSLAV